MALWGLLRVSEGQPTGYSSKPLYVHRESVTMTTKKDNANDEKLAQLEADLAFYKGLMDTVRKKSRAVPEIGEALFGVMRHYQRKLKEEANR